MPRVSLVDSETKVDVNEGEVLYDSLMERGIELPHGCLSGSCGACRVEIVEGCDNLMPPGKVEQNTIEALKEEFLQKHGNQYIEGKIIRLSCRAKVTGDVAFRLLK